MEVHQALYILGKELQQVLGRSLVGGQGKSGHFAEKKISCCCRICTLHSLVAIPTELSRLPVKNNQK